MELEERALDQLPGYVPYRSDFLPSMRINEFVARFQDLEANARAEEHDIRLCGRVSRIRRASSKLVFVDIISEDTVVQVLASRNWFEDSAGDGDSAAQFRRVVNAIRRGDVLGASLCHATLAHTIFTYNALCCDMPARRWGCVPQAWTDSRENQALAS